MANQLDQDLNNQITDTPETLHQARHVAKDVVSDHQAKDVVSDHQGKDMVLDPLDHQVTNQWEI